MMRPRAGRPDLTDFIVVTAFDRAQSLVTVPVRRGIRLALVLSGLAWATSGPATTTEANAAATCTGASAPALTSSSKVVGLVVNGQSYDVLTDPVTIPLVLATLRINATINEPGRITRRAIWLDNALLPDVVIGEATADYSGNPCSA